MKLQSQLPGINNLIRFYKGFTKGPRLNSEQATLKTILARTAGIELELSHHFPQVNKPVSSKQDTFIPTVIVRLQVEDVIFYKKASAKLYLDHQVSSALIYRNAHTVFVDNVLGDELSHPVKTNQTDRVTLIRPAKRIGKHLFFLEFSGMASYQRSFLGYFDRGEMRFIGYCRGKLRLFENIDQLIDKVFGSKLKYHQMIVNGPGRVAETTLKTDVIDANSQNIIGETLTNAQLAQLFENDIVSLSYHEERQAAKHTTLRGDFVAK